MNLLAVFIGLAALVAADTGDSTLPIDPALTNRLTPAENILGGEVHSGREHKDIPSTRKFNALSTRLVGLLEEHRDVFETGTETIPPLDPFLLDALGPIHIQLTGLITGSLNVQDIQIRGLKQFVIDNLSFSFIGMTLRFDFTVPEIDFKAQYQLDSHVAVFIPYNPSGDVRIRVDNAKVYGFAGLGRKRGGFMRLSGFQLNFALGNFVATTEGVIGVTFINDIFNFLLNLFGPGILQGQIEHISELVTEQIRDMANEFIGQYSLADLRR